jgi:hypothetical protein
LDDPGFNPYFWGPRQGFCASPRLFPEKLTSFEGFVILNDEATQSFMRALVNVAGIDGPPLIVQVKYRGDDFVYDGWPPLDGASIKAHGLGDPGLGSGPLSYDRIEFIIVPRVPTRLVDLLAYSVTYERFAELCIGLKFVEVSAIGVRLY